MKHKSLNAVFNLSSLLYILQILVSVLLLVIPAIKNGFPLLYSDSATYIVSGQDAYVPIDRPVIYGFIIRYISLSYSLWLVVIFQALIVVLLINRLLSYFNLNRIKLFATLLVVLFLSLFTGVSNYTSQIMPDIFTGVLILAYSMLLVEPNNRWRWLLISAVLISSMMHFSNLALSTTLAIIAFITVAIYRNRFIMAKRLLMYFAILAIFPWLLAPSVNYLYSGEFYLNKSNHIFFTGRLIETGCLSEFFESVPAAQQYSLYSAKDRLPEKSWQFIWDETSPLYDGNCSETGGWSNCWREKEQEYNVMIKDVLSNSHILAKFLRVSLVDWAKQLIDFDTGHLIQQGENSGFSHIIPKYFSDAECYRTSKQYHETLAFETGSLVQRWCIYISFSLLLLYMIRPFWIEKEWTEKFRMLFAMVVVGFISNAVFCAVLSTVLNRYQGRIIWLLPLLLSVVMLLFLREKYLLWADRSNRKIQRKVQQ
ncbi:MAG: hypothetical protein U1C46_09660 [Bacteroidales bacterium]|nr:hypothetical protein [Bacteroidales bacterium]